ncbi:hypothetical protein Lsed01_02341 [Demequina sediminis]|uniref:SLH domain-containing protein n=1 Tax=Demequina sediminis TaxID=1930058 RepID=A0ABP9WLR3_9MICO|nr:S-layer homology domain-containing protein [Demequina sediminis]BDZ60654.1 hypothetical protein GCM10025873_04450 [Demequina sediminis]
MGLGSPRTLTKAASALAALTLALGIPLAVAPAASADSSTTILELTNDYRASKGLKPLRWNQDVANVASAWSASMLSSRTLAHNRKFSSQIPGGWSRAAENVGYACGYSSAEKAAAVIMNAWKNSPDHDENLRGDYTDIGIGFAWDASSTCAYATQNFAKYSSSSTSSIFGTLVSPSGTPVSGATVYARYSGGTRSTTTDSAGDYKLTNLPRTTYTLEYRTGSTALRSEYFTDAPVVSCASRVKLGGTDLLRVNAKLSPSTAPVADGSTVLCDVSPDKTSSYYSAFAGEIQWLADAGITTGWSNGYGGKNYKPLTSTTRDAMAAFLYRLEGEPPVDTAAAPEFTDTASSAFQTEIAWLATTGITTGWSTPSGREFRPTAQVTRDAMAAFLYRYAGEPPFTPPATSPFTDVATTSPFYKEITWLAETGITTGWSVSGGKKEFRPLNKITRDAMAAFLFRFDEQGL